MAHVVIGFERIFCMMPLFTIIIPHYNSTQSLIKLIMSIPSNDSIQVIVVDDKSQQDTSAAERLILSRGGLFLHNTTVRKGAGTCRNLGLPLAKGKWLIFADADDYFLDNAFDIMQEHADSEADIVYFAPISKYLGTDRIAKRHIEYEKMVNAYINLRDEYSEAILRYKFMAPWSRMIRNQFVQNEKITFEEVPAANDVMFSMQTAFLADRIEAYSDQIYCITQSEGTLTTKQNETNYWSRVEVFARRYKYMQEHLDIQRFGYVFPMGIRMIINAMKSGYNMRFLIRIYRYFKEKHVKMISVQGLSYIVCRHKI